MSGRVPVLDDVYGNLPAVEAVLDQVDALAVDTIAVGGTNWTHTSASIRTGRIA